jgi:predicted glycosyltransferase
MDVSRLDVLIYAHDGRGLGHASRSIAIGLALRRLHPKLKVLFVSGSNFSKELIGDANLDWLKLPSYRTQVVNGTSTGVSGDSLFSDKELGIVRAKSLLHFVTMYRPRVVLADHTPQGKHRELVEAVLESGRMDKKERPVWILGVRGVVGEVSQAKSQVAEELFRNHYSHLFWYGDSRVLGRGHLDQLEQQYGATPVECGYVLRLAEYVKANSIKVAEQSRFCGTISIPWQGEKTEAFLPHLAAAIHGLGAGVGQWKLFLGGADSGGDADVTALFAGLTNCSPEPPSAKYVSSLLQSNSAVIYGGYNSLMDVVYAGIPAVVILREMQDAEQQVHLRCLKNVLGERLKVVSESDLSPTLLKELLLSNLQAVVKKKEEIALDGAQKSADFIHSLLL